MARSRIALLVAATGLLAACGGSTTPAAPPASSTLPVAATAAPATSTTTVASTTRTVAPTTTTVDPVAKVKADFLATREAYVRCAAAPSTCDVSALAVPGSKAFTSLTSFFEKLAANGLLGRPGPRDYVVFEDIQITADGQTATIKTCILDSGVIYDPRTGDPADDAIVNDAVVSARATWTLVLAGGRWLRSSSILGDERTGENICPPPQP